MKFQHVVLLCLVVPLFGQVKISAPDVSINNDGEAIIKIDFSASKTFEENELIFSTYKTSNPLDLTSIKFSLLENFENKQRLTIALKDSYVNDYFSFRLSFEESFKKDIFIFLPSDARRIISQRKQQTSFTLPAKKIVGEPEIFEPKENNEPVLLAEDIDIEEMDLGLDDQNEFTPITKSTVYAEEIDTIWSVSKSLASSYDASIYQIMWALFMSNPDAFIDGNIHKVRSDLDLNIPSANEIELVDSESAKESINFMDPNIQKNDSKLILTSPEDSINYAENEPIIEDESEATESYIDPVSNEITEPIPQATSQATPEKIVDANTSIVNLKASSDSNRQVSSSTDRSSMSLIIISLLSFAFGVTIAYFLISRGKKTIKNDNDETDIQDSNLDTELSIENDDEMQQLDLARAYIEMGAFEDANKILDALQEASSSKRILDDIKVLQSKLEL
jgi:FimV-like protein